MIATLVDWPSYAQLDLIALRPKQTYGLDENSQVLPRQWIPNEQDRRRCVLGRRRFGCSRSDPKLG